MTATTATLQTLHVDDVHHVVPTVQGDLTLLHGASFTIAAGETAAIMGRSGSGKTTLLSIVGLMLRATRGEVVIAGQPTSRLSDAERARLRNQTLGFVFQGYSLVPHLTAGENVALPLSYGPAVSSAERRAAAQLLEMVGLGHAARRYPRHLSGGEQQRVAIARALVRSPGLLLADEPTGALDVATGEAVLDLLLDVARARGTSVLVVTHDEAVAARTDRRLLIVEGRLSEDQAACAP